MNTKEILQKLREVFTTPEIETELSQDIELSEEIKDVDVNEEEVELAEVPKEEEAPVEEKAPEVVYATKMELDELKQTFLKMLESLQGSNESKQDVPQDLSSDVEVELSEDTDELTHSPELEVDKKVDLYVPKGNKLQSVQARIYEKLFN